MKKIVGVTGYKGRLGSYLLNRFSNFVGLDCDVTDPESVYNSVRSTKPEVILHLAAKSGVEFCERPENSALVTDVNFRGTYNTLLAAESAEIEVILLSSDHIFDGKWWGKYLESSKPNPVNFYGMSKLAAESLSSVFDNLRIVRTSYLFDADRLKNTMVKMWNGDEIDSPTFIYRSFMYLPHMAQSLMYYIENIAKMPKLLHISGSKVISWDQFHKDLCGIYGIRGNIRSRRVTFDEGYLAKRPNKGGLDVRWSKNLGIPQYSYLDGLLEMSKK